MYALDLPGLQTQGDDLDDATKNAEEALSSDRLRELL